MTIEDIYQVFLAHPEVNTDSRNCPAGSMFFALKGVSFDGNRFAAKALEDGAAVAVVDDAGVVVEGDSRYILVDDVLATLQQLAAYHRRQFHGPVLQVTGTNGKTTTKELLAAVLAKKFRVHYTQGNLNNHIGVPLTLLRLRTEEVAARYGSEPHEIAVIETGANHPDEIAFLTAIADPDYGLVTNVGRAHLEGFGSFEGVKRTKGELYDYLLQKEGARLFVNESNDDLRGMLTERGAELGGGRCIGYAHSDTAPSATCICQGEVLSCSPLLTFGWAVPGGEPHRVDTRLIGAYNVDNVLAAVAVGLHFGVRPDDISDAISSYQPSLGRSELRRTADNELIVDAYNANLTSMQAALENFRLLDAEQKMLILGDMKELGDASAKAHEQVLTTALQSGARRIWLVGREFRKAQEALSSRQRIPEDCRVRTFDDVEAVKTAIAEDGPTGQLILIKGSNSTRLHQLPSLL